MKKRKITLANNILDIDGLMDGRTRKGRYVKIISRFGYPIITIFSLLALTYYITNLIIK